MESDAETTTNDLELARRALAGDPAAGDDLARRLACVPAFVRHHAGRLGFSLSRDDVADAAQNVLVAVCHKLSTYDGRVRLEAWAFGFAAIELRKARDRSRRDEPVVPLTDDALRAAAEADDAVAIRDYDAVEEELSRLGPPESDVLRLKHYHGRTFDQIARRLELPLGTVKTLYYRGIEHLRPRLARLWRGERR